MTATIYTPTHAGPARKPESGVKAFFRNLLNRMIEARMREAERRILDDLISHTDQSLRDLGYSPAEIRDIRMRKRVPVPTGRYII